MAICNSNHLNWTRVRRTVNISLTPIILVAIALLIFFSDVSISQAQVNNSTKPVEIDLFVDGLSVLRPEALLEESLKSGGKTNLTIENKPSGLMNIKSVKQLPVTINVTQPDGSVKELPDPSAQFQTHISITLTGKAQIQNTGAVIGESLVKIGSPAKLEGFNYDINAKIIDLRMDK